MKRGTVFRIVGLAFLAFAVVIICQGEFGLEGTDVVITRANDPESFWRGVILVIGGGCALLYLSRIEARKASSSSASLRLDGRGESLTSPQPVEQRLKLPNYDSDFCRKVVKGAVYVCFGLIVAELLVLLFVHPSDDQCPGWIFHRNQPSAASLWVLAAMFTVLPTLWIGNVALRWDHYDRRMYDDLVNGPPQYLLMNINWLVPMVMAVWCLFCAIPFILMLGQCTALPHYLNLRPLHF